MNFDNVDLFLEQIEFHNSSYEWVVRESEKIAKELKALDLEVNFNVDTYEKVTKRFLELEQRYKRNKKDYDAVVKQIRAYFEDKHGIDIMGLLDDRI
jgi:peptidoglycan hydrolase CwlO-like protein